MEIINKIHLKQVKNKPELIFVVIALIYGLTFLFITPPFQVSDENEHFIKAVGLSEGYWIPEKQGNHIGLYISDNVSQLVMAYPYDIVNESTFTFSNRGMFVDLSDKSIVTYSPVSYVLPAFVIKVAGFFGLPVLWMLYIARLVNLLVWSFLTYFAIKIIPVQKWAFLLVALMPMTLFQAASVSADSLTIGLSFLAIAYILKLAFDSDPIRKLDFVALLVLGCLIALSKSIYILIFALFLLIPKSKFKGYKKKYALFLVLVTVIVSIVLSWMSLTTSLYAPPIINWSITGQIQFILNNPLVYMKTFIFTMQNLMDIYLISFVGYFGWLQFPLPFLWVMLYLLVIMFVGLVDKNEFKISLNQRIFSLFFVLVSIFSIFAFQYLTYNSVGRNFIGGVQGRYFIPFAPMLFVLFYNNIEQVTYFNRTFSFKLNNLSKQFLIEFIVITLSLSLFIIFNSYSIIYKV